MTSFAPMLSALLPHCSYTINPGSDRASLYPVDKCNSKIKTKNKIGKL